MQEGPPDPEAWAKYLEEHRAEAAEFEAELEAAERRIGALLDVLAWLLRQMADPRPMARRRDWPDAWLCDHSATRAAAMVDPLLFDLARLQVAAILDRTELRAGFEVVVVAGWAAKLLRAERPGSGQGSPPGRSGTRLLISALWTEMDSWHLLWTLPERHAPGDPWSCGVWLPDFARALSDRLREHPLLADLPKAVLEPRAIKDIVETFQRRRPLGGGVHSLE